MSETEESGESEGSAESVESEDENLPKNALEYIEFAKKGTIKHGILRMQTLWRPNTRGKYQQYTMYIGIGSKPLSKEQQRDKKGNWVKHVKWIKVTDKHIRRGPIPDGAVGIWWAEGGQEDGTMTISNPHVFNKYSPGSGIRLVNGEEKITSNYKTPFTLALSKAKTIHDKRVRKGDKVNKESLLVEGKIYSIEKLIKKSGDLEKGSDKFWRVCPMAIHNIKDNWDKVKFPCFIQPKLDGTRLVVIYHPNLPLIEIKDPKNKEQTLPATLDFYTRTRHQFEGGQTHILLELLPALKKFPGLYLDGELYKKGYALEDISGSSRRIIDESKSGRSKAIKLEYWIYDCFYVDQPKMPYKERKKILDKFFIYLREKGKAHDIVQVDTFEAKDKKELKVIHRGFLDQKLEGSVVRNRNSPYEIGLSVERRSRFTLKWKETEDAEFKVVDFKEGDTGKEVGLIMFILEVKAKDGKKTFKTTPNWDEETRRRWFKALKKTSSSKKDSKKDSKKNMFEKYWKGQLATIKFKGYTGKGVPAEPKFLRFRDEKYNHLENFDL